MNKKDNLRVLIVHNYYQIPGGEDTVVKNEKENLERHGNQVLLYTRSNKELSELNKFQKFLLPMTTIFSLKTFIEVRKIIKQKNIDIVHVHNTLSLVSPSVYYAALSCRVPVVQTIHNFRLICPGATLHRFDKNNKGNICEECIKYGLRKSLKYRCYRGSLLQTTACVLTLKIHQLLGIYNKLYYICLTEFNKEKLLEININKNKKIIINPHKVFVKPNFVDNNSNVIPYEKRKNQFIYVGRIDNLKGVKILLEAWREIKNIDLIICGIGPEEDWCKQYIKKYRMNNVYMKGFIPNYKIKKYIGESKALVLPTQWYEGFPMTIVESLSMGTPIVGSNIGNVQSLINNNIGLTFDYRCSKSLIESVYQINNMCKKAYSEYLDKYTAIENYKMILDIYSNILENKYQ